MIRCNAPSIPADFYSYRYQYIYLLVAYCEKIVNQDTYGNRVMQNLIKVMM